MRPAVTTLRFDYSARQIMLDPLTQVSQPGTYDLCFDHAARSNPPEGWTLRDRGPSRESATETAPPVGPERDHGVDRLAAALCAVPRAVSEDAPDAVPVRADRSVLDALLGSGPRPPVAPSVAVASEQDRSPIADIAGVAGVAGIAAETGPTHSFQPLRLMPDPVATVWCADLLPATGPVNRSAHAR